MRDNNSKGVLRSLDWVTILIYMFLLVFGWISVCGASYDFDQGGNIFSFDSRSGMQMVWMGTSLVLGAVILMLDERYFDTFANLLYIGMMALLLVTPLLAPEDSIKGSYSWIKIGSFSIQPAEFAKFVTALTVAKCMNTYGFSMKRWRDFATALFIVLLPLVLIIMQRETGSALVYLAFFLMFYREGMPGSILFAGLAAVIYFVVGIRFEADLMWDEVTSVGHYTVLLLIAVFTVGMVWVYCAHDRHLRYMLWTFPLFTVLPTLFSVFVIPFDISWALLAYALLLTGYLCYVAISERLMRYFYIALFSVGSLAFFYSADFVMNNMMEAHQQTRIRVLLGLEDDPKGKGYNVIQAKIAIGSGGLEGKGFLNGTQTKLKYVPEQDTDFIFCTVGEEEGFLGSAAVLLLFLAFVLRLIHLAERQIDTFGRVYGYSVMSIFLFHVFINVGMVLGLTPVIGIPLPFFSYGGSSLWGFTILLFIFLRIDAGRNRLKR